MINFGMRGHDIPAKTPAELARRIKKLNMNYVQLAIPKSFPDLNLPECLDEVKSAMDENGVKIQVLSCYIDLLNPEHIARFKDFIHYAAKVDAYMVGTESASHNFDEVYPTLLSNIKELVAEAEKAGVNVGIEGVAVGTISSPEQIKKILDDVNSDNLKVIFDPINLLTPDTYQQMNSLIDKCFDMYGDKIEAIHLKDCVIEDGHFKVVALGTGFFDTDYLFKVISERKPELPVLMENQSEEKAIAFFNKK